ncbi:MAG: thiamine pyrophosphate-dependent dehydrogenase E1 component subunit alpha, partial [Mariniphaga sp.]|nr:thiamine pyrophosphate-dependent dehydrogenase E1 component subunit alpha [Mariniphaga sp.]
MIYKEIEKVAKQVLLIRKFEERTLRLFQDGHITGTTHTYIGQEANAVAIINQLNNDDWVVSNHRCHGHYLMKTNKIFELFSELMGKTSGVCKGKGGSQHLYDTNFFTNGIQGSIIPNAAGVALGQKLEKSTAITVVFIGDGTLGQGVLYETLNMASLWDLPLLFVCENNGIAQTTETKYTIAGKIIDRGKAFGIISEMTESTNVFELSEIAEQIVKNIRETSRPFFWEIKTIRLSAHSKGDDNRS